MLLRFSLLLSALALTTPAHAQNDAPNFVADTVVGRSMEAPVNTRPVDQKFWWSDAWYNDGQLDVPVNHAVVEREIAYINPEKLGDVKQALFKAKVGKMSVTNAVGCGEQQGFEESYRGITFEVNLLKKIEINLK